MLCFGKKQPTLDQNAKHMGDKTEGEDATGHQRAEGNGEYQEQRQQRQAGGVLALGFAAKTKSSIG